MVYSHDEMVFSGEKEFSSHIRYIRAPAVFTGCLELHVPVCTGNPDSCLARMSPSPAYDHEECQTRGSQCQAHTQQK